MKKRIERLTALILAMAICLGLLSASVLAAESEPATENGSASAQISEDECSSEESTSLEDETEPKDNEQVDEQSTADFSARVEANEGTLPSEEVHAEESLPSGTESVEDAPPL